MADSNPYTASTPTEAQEAKSAPSAYCQECGRALTTGTMRRLAGGIYCLPCAAPRSEGGGWQTVPNGGYGNHQVPGAAPTPQGGGSTNPARACVLGFIPGVGAMYNGQYGKAALHLIVFVGLLTLADHLNDAFYWLVWGWVFYQVFDAYHTAKARREGLPLPDPFGWNEVGERWGFSSRSSTGAPVAYAPARPVEVPAGQAPPAASAPWQSSPSTESRSGVPPVAATSRPYAPIAEFPRPQPAFTPDRGFTASQPGAGEPLRATPTQPREVAWQASPATAFSPTYMGDQSIPSLSSPTRRFPAGAFWLIGLGLLFLLGNVIPHFAIQGPWLVPLILLGVAVWSGARRVDQQRRATASKGKPFNLACALSGPVILVTLAVLMSLQAAHVSSLARTWPVLLVIWGGMLLAQRALERPAYTYADPDEAAELPETLPVRPVRSASGTGSLGL